MTDKGRAVMLLSSGTVTPISPVTGHPTRPVKLILMGVRLEDWLVRHAEDDLPAPLERWVELAAADRQAGSA